MRVAAGGKVAYAMKRRLLIIGMFLLLGAVANVARSRLSRAPS